MIFNILYTPRTYTESLQGLLNTFTENCGTYLAKGQQWATNSLFDGINSPGS